MGRLTGNRYNWMTWPWIGVIGQTYAWATFALCLLALYGPQPVRSASALSLFGLLVLSGLALGSLMGLEILSHILGANWSRVEAEVLDVKYQGLEFGTSINIRYRYQWEGQPFEGIRNLAVDTASAGEADSLLARYAAGNRAEVRVCATVPLLSVLEPRFRFSLAFAALEFSMLFLSSFAGGVFLVWAILQGSWREVLDSAR